MVEGLAQAEQLVESSWTPRYRRLDTLERATCGEQYEGRPDWFLASEVPLTRRAPCVVYPIAGIAIESYQDLLLGQHRFPDVAVEGLAEDEASDIAKKSRWRAICAEALSKALGCGTAVVIASLRDGKPCLDTVRAKWCTPLRTDDGELWALEVRYAYVDVDRIDGRLRAKAWWYRRIITSDRDVVFAKTPVVKDREPEWVEATVVEHGLGFCPIVWYACRSNAEIVNEVDGHALHEQLLDEIEALDMSLSQRQRASYFAGEPQWVETGVEPGTNPAPARYENVAMGSDGQPYRAPVVGNVRRKGAGNVWQYESDKVDVELHQLDSGALDAISKNAEDVRLKLCEAMAFVPLDPADLPRVISGVALEVLRARQIARCDTLRDDFASGFMIPTIVLLCRMVGKVIDPEQVEITWPEYFKPTKQERATLLTAELSAATQASMLRIESPTFQREMRKRIARMMVEGVTEDVIAKIEAEIDANTPDEPAELPENDTSEDDPGEGDDGETGANGDSSSDSEGLGEARANGGRRPPTGATARSQGRR